MGRDTKVFRCLVNAEQFIGDRHDVSSMTKGSRIFGKSMPLIEDPAKVVLKVEKLAFKRWGCRFGLRPIAAW
jgi:hypothetical protein